MTNLYCILLQMVLQHCGVYNAWFVHAFDFFVIHLYVIEWTEVTSLSLVNRKTCKP